MSATTNIQGFLLILNAALAGLAKVGPISAVVNGIVSPEIAQAVAFLSIIQTAQAAVVASSGQPIDLTRIPLESPVQ